MTPRRVGWGLLVVLALAAIVARPTPQHGPPRSMEGTAERVVIVTVPGLRWGDASAAQMPILRALLARSAVGLLSTQTAALDSGADDAYATLGAGARVVGSVRAVAFEPEEAVGLQTAGERFEASAGQRVAGAELILPGVGSLRGVNDGLPYAGEVGALAEALDGAGIDRAVVAAADIVASDGQVVPRRHAALALTDEQGRIDRGATGASVLVADEAAPFGLRYDGVRVLEALDAAWGSTGVVLVEASSTARAAAAGPGMAPGPRAAADAAALREADRLIGEIEARLDGRTTMIVAGPYAGAEELTVVAVAGLDVPSGLLRSASTRRAGHLLLVDLAPTVLSLLDVARPSSMEGRAAEVMPDGRAAEVRFDELAEIEAAAVFRDEAIGPVATAWIVVQIVVLGLALLAWRSHPSLRSGVLTASLSLLVYVPLTFAATALPMHRWGLLAYLALTTTVAVAGAVVLRWLAVDAVGALMGALACVVGLLALDVVTGASLQMNAVFGYTPTVAGRFAGVGNLAFAQLSAAALLLAALVAWRRDGRHGWGVAALLLAAVVLVDGLPFWGSDVGGVLALVPAAGLLLVLLSGRRPRLATWLLLGVAAVVVVGSFLATDLARPEEERTHLARLAESVDATGLDAFVVVARRKIAANLSVLTSSALVLAVPVLLAIAGWSFWRGPGPYGVLQRRIPPLRPAMGAFFLVAVLGFALNDSGIAVPATAFGILNATLCALVVAEAVRGSGSSAAGGAGEPSAPQPAGGSQPAPART